MSAILRHRHLLLCNGAMLSVQHYPLPAGGGIAVPMASCGAVPLHAVDARRILVPAHAADALWLGVAAAGAGIVLRAALQTAHHGMLDAVTGTHWRRHDAGRIAVPPATALDGVARAGGGWWPFARRPAAPEAPASRRLHLHIAPAAPGAAAVPAIPIPPGAWLSLHFVAPAAFRRLSGTDPGAPADPADRFGGDLLG